MVIYPNTVWNFSATFYEINRKNIHSKLFICKKKYKKNIAFHFHHLIVYLRYKAHFPIFSRHVLIKITLNIIFSFRFMLESGVQILGVLLLGNSVCSTTRIVKFRNVCVSIVAKERMRGSLTFFFKAFGICFAKYCRCNCLFIAKKFNSFIINFKILSFVRISTKLYFRNCSAINFVLLNWSKKNISKWSSSFIVNINIYLLVKYLSERQEWKNKYIYFFPIYKDNPLMIWCEIPLYQKKKMFHSNFLHSGIVWMAMWSRFWILIFFSVCLLHTLTEIGIAVMYILKQHTKKVSVYYIKSIQKLLLYLWDCHVLSHNKITKHNHISDIWVQCNLGKKFMR